MEGGTRLGPYEILEPLGAGGMGEVHRARDTKLDRNVAIKVLPEGLGSDPDRLARFVREAKLLASLNHANIATIYGLEDFDGIRFISMEVVEGETLAAHLERGRLPVEVALATAARIADALEAAHDKGIIHRDLKPANVMLTADWKVKVLDFGLAKALAAEESAADLSQSPTSDAATQAGVIMGTAAYMSPEQARGQPLDKRTDIWSFGCVLYEMLAGKSPFAAGTLSDTMAEILREDPDWAALPSDVPREATRLLRRCLSKDPRRRLRDIGDAGLEIEEITQRSNLPTTATGSGSISTRRSWLLPLLSGVTVAALLLAAWAWTQPRSEQRPAMRSVVLLEPARLDIEKSSALDLAPDGSGLVYAADHEGLSRLYYRALDSFEATPIDGTVGAQNPFFSPDGAWVGFFSGDFTLAKVPTAGGVVVSIYGVPVGNRGAVWLPDDTIVYGTNTTGMGLMRVPAEGGTPVEITTVAIEAGEIDHGWPHALPGGRAVLFSVTTASGGSVAVVDLESGERHMVIDHAIDARYVDPGHLVFTEQDTLFATRFDPDRLEVSGTPRPIVDDLFVFESRRSRASYVIGANGTLVYATGDAGPRRDRFVWVDREGNVDPLPVEPGSYGHPRLSPDNRHVAYDATIAGRGQVWVYDLRRQTPTRLTDRGDNMMPIWSPDGQRVLYAASGRGGYGLAWQRSDGGGESQNMLATDLTSWPVSWHDTTIAYYEISPETGRDIWVYTEGEAQPRSFQQSRFNERSPMLSPDGRWIAYVSNESGRDEVYAKEVAGDGRQHTISNGGGSEPVWSTDGTELFYRSGEWLFAVPIEAGDDLRVGSPGALFQGSFKFEPLGGNQMYAVTADGQHFLMIDEGEAPRGTDSLHLVLDFASELTSTEPTGS